MTKKEIIKLVKEEVTREFILWQKEVMAELDGIKEAIKGVRKVWLKEEEEKKRRPSFKKTIKQ